jgi:hypothetical protein
MRCTSLAFAVEDQEQCPGNFVLPPDTISVVPPPSPDGGICLPVLADRGVKGAFARKAPESLDCASLSPLMRSALH